MTGLAEFDYVLTEDEKTRVVLGAAIECKAPAVVAALDMLVLLALAHDKHDLIGHRCRQTIRQMASVQRGEDPFMAFALVGRTLHTRDPHAMAALENFVDVALSRSV